VHRRDLDCREAAEGAQRESLGRLGLPVPEVEAEGMKLSTTAHALTVVVVLITLATAVFSDYDWRLGLVCFGIFLASYLAGWCDGFLRGAKQEVR
jgi:hypothetical protein